MSGRDLGTAVPDAPELDREVGACCKALAVLQGVPGLTRPPWTIACPVPELQRAKDAPLACVRSVFSPGTLTSKSLFDSPAKPCEHGEGSPGLFYCELSVISGAA